MGLNFKQMKHYFTIAFTLILGFTLNAQNQEKAKEILDKVSAKTKEYTTIKADFSFAMENLQEEISEIHEGTILLKGNKYKVSLMGVDTYYDGTIIYTHMLDAEEVNISEPDPDDETTLNPATIFTIYENGYNYMYVGETTENGKTFHEIDLFPENRDKPFSRIKLKIEKDNLQLYSLSQVGKDGSNYTITVKQMTNNSPMNDSNFVFDQNANPEVDVIDMR
ncbi:outer membrane lipoprotein carrier protein LolA [Marinilabiliaceae bacterium JC017]|nr:outer membrane lipoprotein carrier protein LolA [Marinilabiliaceae bacterium JC017]